MPKRILLAVFLQFALPVPAFAQAFMEAGGVYAGVAGLGAGLAASQNHGQAIKSSYELAIQAQQALVAQNKAIAQYIKLGSEYEAKKDWVAAEKCFKYVLQVVNRRDGPGSPNGLPALKHLVTINVAQNKIEDAIGLQKTVVAFTQSAKKSDPQAIVKSKLDLSNLFIQKGDYTSAEPVLAQSVTTCSESPAQVRPPDRRAILKNYSQVLRKLNKTAQAIKIEEALSLLDEDHSTTAAGAGSDATAAANNSAPEAGGAAPQSPVGKASTNATATPNAQPNNIPVDTK